MTSDLARFDLDPIDAPGGNPIPVEEINVSDTPDQTDERTDDEAPETPDVDSDEDTEAN